MLLSPRPRTLLPEFIDFDEDVRPGVIPGLHRLRTIDELARLFDYHRSHLVLQHQKFAERISETSNRTNDPFFRELRLAWCDAHCKFYQPKQRLLMGILLSAARILGVDYVEVDRRARRALVVRIIVHKKCEDGAFVAQRDQKPSEILKKTFNLSLGGNESRADEWLNSRLEGLYDLRDEMIFRRVG